MRNTVGEHSGFSGTCAGNNQKRLTPILHGLALLRI
jgi:hypothetical protein